MTKKYNYKQQGCEKGRHDENNMTLNNKVVKRGHDENNMTLNNKVVKKKRGHDENNMTINNKVVKKGGHDETI